MMNRQLKSIGLAIALAGLGAPLLAGAQVPPAAAGPQMNPKPGCKVSDKELEENRTVAMQFFKVRGADRVALADPGYIQHNPVFKKRSKESGLSDYDEFKKAFAAPPAGQAPPAAAAAATPQPPVGNDYEIVTAECDIVTIVRKIYRQDPNEAPGTFYESFFFDSFRIKNGKLVEHWDAALIQPNPAR